MINSSLKQSIFDKYAPYLLGTLLLIGGGMLGFWGYRLYLDKIEQAAFKDLAESIEAFNAFVALNPEKQVASGGTQKLDDLEQAFIVGAQKYDKSKLIPFFYLYKADSLIQKGDFNAALVALESAIDKIEKNNPFYYLLLSKKALLQADNDASREQGIKELNELAMDANNPFAPMSGYYLGLHYYHAGNVAKAKDIWKDALDKQESSSVAKECSWCDQIRSKLNTIS